MPIANRCIVPVLVSQVKVPPTVGNEFEYIVNATLSNLIKQISCLSLKANDIFGELESSLIKFADRTEALEFKINAINDNICHLDTSIMEPLINQQVYVYRSIIDKDDLLLDHTPMPDCIKEVFDEALPPPELSQLDKYRGKDEESLRFYTDPDFFLREWLKNARNDRKKMRERNKNRKSKHINRQTMQPSFPPPVMIDPIVQEASIDNNTLDYNFCDVAVYEDPTVFNISKEKNTQRMSVNECAVKVDDEPLLPIPPPPPIMTNFPTCLPPVPPPPTQTLKAPMPATANLFADIQKGKSLKPVSMREEVKETKEKTRDLREFIKELRPAWDNRSDDSDDSDD